MKTVNAFYIKLTDKKVMSVYFPCKSCSRHGHRKLFHRIDIPSHLKEYTQSEIALNHAPCRHRSTSEYKDGVIVKLDIPVLSPKILKRLPCSVNSINYENTSELDNHSLFLKSAWNTGVTVDTRLSGTEAKKQRLLDRFTVLNNNLSEIVDNKILKSQYNKLPIEEYEMIRDRNFLTFIATILSSDVNSFDGLLNLFEEVQVDLENEYIKNQNNN